MIKLLRGGKDAGLFSVQHAQNILNHAINSKVKDELKYSLPTDSEYKREKDGKLVKKEKKK